MEPCFTLKYKEFDLLVLYFKETQGGIVGDGIFISYVITLLF